MQSTIDKFESCLDKPQEKFETKMDKVYGELYVVNDRIDKLAADMKLLKQINSLSLSY